MYEKIYSLNLSTLNEEKIEKKLLKEEYLESYNFSKENYKRVQLYISEPIMYF
jgi:hypothetical protein